MGETAKRFAASLIAEAAEAERLRRAGQPGACVAVRLPFGLVIELHPRTARDLAKAVRTALEKEST